MTMGSTVPPGPRNRSVHRVTWTVIGSSRSVTHPSYSVAGPPARGGGWYDATVRRWVIADAHVGQEPGDAGRMAKLVRSAPEHGVGEIVYLGDAFQYLVGMEKLWIEAVRTVLPAWDAVRRRGVRIVLVEGNRDFFLDHPDLAAHRDEAGLVYEFTAGGRRFRAVHGDRVNQRDLAYRFWRRLSKSPLSRLGMAALPRGLARRIVAGMEARLATTNRRFRYEKPVEALRREARAAWAEGGDVLLWGHFHTAWETSEGSRRALVVPAWLRTGTVLTVEPDGAFRLGIAGGP